MKSWAGFLPMILTQVLAVMGVQWLWHRVISDRIFEDYILSADVVQSMGGNTTIFEQVIAGVREEVGTILLLVGAIAIATSITWYCIAQLSPIHTPGHVDDYRQQWWQLAALGMLAAGLVTWLRLPIDVGGAAKPGLPFLGVLVFVVLYYVAGSLLWTPRPLRPVVPGASNFSII